MQMRKSDWLSHCSLSATGVQWLELVYEMAKVFRFAKALDENVDENVKLKY